MEKCPICEYDLKSEPPPPDGRSAKYSCNNCGDYKIADMAINEIKKKNKRERALISHLVRKLYDSGNEVTLFSDTIEEWLKEKELPNPKEQADNLVLWLGKHVRQGKTIDLKPWKHLGIVGSDSEEGLGLIIDYLDDLGIVEQDKIQRSAKSSIRSVMLKGKGWEKYEVLSKEKQKESNRNIKVFISYFSEDKKKMEVLKGALLDAEFNFEPIVVSERKQNRKALSHKVKEGIKEADFFVPILTRRSISSQWVNQEIGFCESVNEKKIYPIVEKSIVSKLKGFIHNQMDLSFTFEGYEDSQEKESIKFKNCCLELLSELGQINIKQEKFNSKYFNLAIIKLGLRKEEKDVFLHLNHEDLGFKIYNNPEKLKRFVVGIIGDNSESDNEILVKIEGYLNHFQTYKTDRKNNLETQRERMRLLQNKPVSSTEEQQGNFKEADAIRDGVFNDALEVLKVFDNIEIILMKESYENKKSIESRYNDICQKIPLKPQPKIQFYDKFDILGMINE